MDRSVYFSDQFFSTGRTDIYNEEKEIKGALDLKSSFTSSLSVEDEQGDILMEAAFPFLLGKWTIWDSKGKVMGELKANFSLFTKKYTYKTNTTTYPIDSPAFSGEYTIYNEREREVATFKKVNGFFQASA